MLLVWPRRSYPSCKRLIVGLEYDARASTNPILSFFCIPGPRLRDEIEAAKLAAKKPHLNQTGLGFRLTVLTGLRSQGV